MPKSSATHPMTTGRNCRSQFTADSYTTARFVDELRSRFAGTTETTTTVPGSPEDSRVSGATGNC